MATMLSTALAWGLSACADADDVLLAMVSPHAYWLLRQWRRNTFGDQRETRAALQDVRSYLVQTGASEDVLRGADVSVRTKGLFSTFHKAVVRGQSVHDVLAVRVVLRKGLGPEACFEAHDVLRGMWESAPGRHKDYVSMPKRNGYQALHDTMILPSGTSFEMQLRTEQMHREAEWGSAAHRRYKGALLRLPAAVLSGVASARKLYEPEAILDLLPGLS